MIRGRTHILDKTLHGESFHLAVKNKYFYTQKDKETKISTRETRSKFINAGREESSTCLAGTQRAGPTRGPFWYSASFLQKKRGVLPGQAKNARPLIYSLEMGWKHFPKKSKEGGGRGGGRFHGGRLRPVRLSIGSRWRTNGGPSAYNPNQKVWGGGVGWGGRGSPKERR